MADAGRDLKIEEILECLRELGDELERQGFLEPVRLVIFGGVFMMVEVQNRNSTRDVDVFLINIPEMTEDPMAPETKRFQKAVKAIARKHHIKQTWLNDDGSMFFTGFTPNARIYHWQTFNKLSISFPEKEAILVLKLMGYRNKDKADVEVLCDQLGVHTYKQAQDLVNDYVGGRWQKEYMLEDTLNSLFP